ncbi:hypothetical protein IWQ51_005209 [Labrenzia sp. EL_142]|nr:hypothetical protein [Labrenzia sp. EL_142]
MNEINLKSLFNRFKDSSLLPLSYFVLTLIANVFVVMEIREAFLENKGANIPSYLIALGLVLSSFMISFSMSFFERFGLSNDIQNHISSEVESLKEKVEELIDSRLSFGLTAAKTAAGTEIDIIQQLEDGDRVFWIDTVLRDYDTLFSQILNKVEECKVEINILLMSPDNVGAEYRKDLIKDIVGHENFIVDAESQETKIFKSIENFSSKKSKGSIVIKYSIDPMVMPVFIFERSRTKHEEAYTGFYLHKLASQTPYLKWESSSTDPFYVHLFDYFEKCWENENNHAPRDHSKPEVE